MDLFTDLDTRVAAIRGLLGDVEAVEQLSAVVTGLDDKAVCRLAELAAQAGALIEQVTLVASGVIAARSQRVAGHSGLAQSRGHRTPTALIQEVAGISRADAIRQIRVGEALIESGADVEPDTALGGEAVTREPPSVPWHAPLGAALRRGTLTSAQHDAIHRGLGAPPGRAGDVGANANAGAGVDESADSDAAAADAAVAAWSLAASRLLEIAPTVPVEELAKQARAIRELLDPVGAQARFDARYERRSFRLWTDSDGCTHGKFVFDDESAAWLRTIIDTALRPRRGGPRFVGINEQQAARALREDPRTNEQLTHDLLVDVWKAGAVADSDTVFGARQAGVRMVQVVHRDDYVAAHRVSRDAGSADMPMSAIQPATRLLDGGETLPASVAAKQRCNTGIQRVTVDSAGNPLDVGREQRLFTSKQRIALAIRDGGCRWSGCDRPAAYCEAHHIDHWAAEQGRTDIDRGVLLCSFHHLQLHNNGWKITRDGLGPFMLRPPPDEGSGAGPPRELREPLALTYSWQLAAPPPRQFRQAA